MADSRIESPAARTVRAQTAVSLALLASIVATVIGVNLLAENRRIAGRIDSYDLERFKNNEELFMNRGSFVEFEDRLLIDEIPNADYSRGGVYFFGSSNLKWAMKTWDLPPEQRALIGNYGIGAISHSLEFQFIRYLVEQRGLLQAGGGKTHVVLGAFWSNAVNWAPEGYFGPLWRRHKLYTYSVPGGIHRADMGRLTAFVRVRKARCSGFIGGNFNRIARWAMTALGQPLERTERLKDPQEIQEWVRAHYAEPRWRQSLTDQVTALDQIIGYLQARDVGLTIVLLPHRSAFDDLPLTGAYQDEVTALCKARSVELVDLSRLLSEDEYWDINHPNYRGLAKTDAALMDLARRHLRRMGLLPSSPPTAGVQAGDGGA